MQKRRRPNQALALVQLASICTWQADRHSSAGDALAGDQMFPAPSFPAWLPGRADGWADLVSVCPRVWDCTTRTSSQEAARWSLKFSPLLPKRVEGQRLTVPTSHLNLLLISPVFCTLSKRKASQKFPYKEQRSIGIRSLTSGPFPYNAFYTITVTVTPHTSS